MDLPPAQRGRGEEINPLAAGRGRERGREREREKEREREGERERERRDLNSVFRQGPRTRKRAENDYNILY